MRLFCSPTLDLFVSLSELREGLKPEEEGILLLVPRFRLYSLAARLKKPFAEEVEL